MTWRKRTIMEMAREAGVTYSQVDGSYTKLEAFVALVRADEREACAKVCEDSVEYAGDTLAQAIRARGDKHD